jgi:lysophospholipase L1-like esterase
MQPTPGSSSSPAPAPMARGGKKRGLAKRVFYSLLPLLIIFVALETIQRVRYFSRNYDRAWLLYGLIPAKNPTRGPKVIRVRPPAFTVAPGNFKTVVCLGSSTTVGIYNDPLHKYPYLLNQLLESRRPADAPFRYRVINYGVAGGSSEGYEMAVERMFEVITPEVVIMYTGYSDIFVKDVNDIYQTFQARLGPVWTALEHRSLLLLTLKEKYIFWKQNQRNSYLQDRSKYGRLEAGFRDNTRTAVRALTAKGVKVILIPEVLIAKRFGAVTGDFTDYAAKYQNIPGILKQLADEEHVELVTVQDAFDNDDYKKYFVDPAHLTNEGNEVLSRLIFERSKILQDLVARH